MFDNLKIGTKLFVTSVSAAVVPVVIVGIIVGALISQAIDRLTSNVQTIRDQMAAGIIGENLKDESVVTAQQVDAYLSERINEVSGWAVNPLVRKAAHDASASAVRQGMHTLSEEQLEASMATTRVVADDPELTNYLSSLEKLNPVFSEILFTEQHGLIAARSNMTSDFVQKGETWWDQAWETGSYVGPVVYDESSLVYSVEIAVRITGEDGSPLGVLKAVLDISAVQALAADAAGRTPDGMLRVANKAGYLLSDTASDNDGAVIMQDRGNLLKRGWAPFQQIVSGGKDSGYFLDQQSLDGTPVIVGYARMASGDYYNLPGFPGFDWYVVLEQPSRVALAPLDAMNNEIDYLQKLRGSMILLFIVITVVNLLVALVFASQVSRGITRPIRDLADVGQRFSSGDMDVSVEVRHKNEIGILENTFQQMFIRLRAMLLSERSEREYLASTVQRYMEFLHGVSAGNLKNTLAVDGSQRAADDPLVRLGNDLNEVSGSLRQMILQVQDTTSQLASASAEIMSATTQQASGASEQSAAIAQTTTTVDEVKTIAETSVMRAQEVADSAQQTVQTSQAGRGSVEDTIESMSQIKEQVERIAENILALSEQMQQIGEITATVNRIASQSNMLALNASVEAARAGDQGRGFSVVAAEVRSLAEQSQQATAQIKEILQDIQKATNTTVMATEEGTKGVERGVRLAFQSRTAIEQLSTVINQSAQNAVQLVAAGQQQSAGVEQVALAMGNINQATIQSLASTRQAERAAHDLHELALRLSQTIAKYQV